MWLHIAGLWAVAVVQPLFDLLGANPEFFVAHRAGAREVLLLTLILTAILPMFLILSVRLAGLAGRRVGSIAFNVVLAMQVAVRAGATTWYAAIPLPAATGIAVMLAYRRWASVRMFFSALSTAALVVPLLFLLKPEVRSLIAGEARGGASAEAPAASGDTPITTPVIFVIFDELPLVSLLDADRTIDRRLYPNFAALARDGVWFRNATTVDDFTRYAVPAIVSGKYPRHSALPSAAHHPDTLFTLLSRTHRLEVSEMVTNLCPERLCPAVGESPLSRRLGAMANDLRIVFLHTILTSDLTRGLPDPTETWAGFGDGNVTPNADDAGESARGADARGEKAAAQAVEQRWRRGMGASRVTPVRQFIESIGSDDPQPTFYFLHALISHQPHRMLPSGKGNKTWVNSVPRRTGWNNGEPWTVAQWYQRHLLQVGFVDTLIGELTQRLRDTGLYERALIVITSDHGISYLPNAPQRDFTANVAPEIMRIPLIIKFPAHIPVTNHISDVNAQSVDIVPTIADALGVTLTWQADGASLLDPRRPERTGKTMFSKGTRHDIDAAALDMEPALRRKLDLFGDAANAHRAPRLPELDTLVGRPVAALRVGDGGGRIEIASPWEFQDVDLDAPDVVFDVGGRLESPRPDTFLAVGVNGVVAAVTRTWESNPRGWLATPNPDSWRPGRNTVDVFVIDRDESGMLLRRATPAHVRPPGLNLISAAAAEEWGVGQGGFYAVETLPEGTQFRWTRDRAALSNLFTHDTPRAVEIDVLMVPEGTPKTLKIEANDCVLFDGVVGGGWSSVLSLDRCGISREGLTLTFTTTARRSVKDRRRHGVALSRVVLR